MIVTYFLLALLVATNVEAQRIKGGRRIIQDPGVIQEPHVHVGKLGGGAALHHTAVATDPVSLNPVVVEQVTPIGSAGGIKTAGLGPVSSPFTIADSQISSFGGRALYRNGASQVPYGLSGLDYFSYPASLLTARRGLRGKTVISDNVSGLRPIGFGRKSAIIADPTTSQFTVGDAQIRSNVLGGQRLYRTGLSPVPFGLSGLDYYSYPRNLLTQRRILGDGLGQTRILSGGGFTAGDAQISSIVAEPLGQERVVIEPTIGGPAVVQTAQAPEQVTTIVEDGGFGQRRVTTVTKSSDGLGGLRGGQIILNGGAALGGLRRVKGRRIVPVSAPVSGPILTPVTASGLAAPFGGFGQRQVAVTKSVAPTIVQAPAQIFRAPERIVQAPVISQAPIVQAPVISQAPIVQAPVVRQRLGEAFLSQVSRPVIAARRVASLGRPVISQPVVQQLPPFPGNIQFTLGGTQIIGGPAVAPAQIVAPAPAPVFAPAPVISRPQQIFAAPARVVAPAPIIRQPVFEAPRPVAVVQRPTIALQSPVVSSVKRPVVSVQQPIVSGVKTAGYGARRILANRIPQMVYVDGSSRYAGIDIIGGYRIGDPRYNYAQLPISASRFANLGLSQGSIDAGPILVAPAPAPAFLTKSVPAVSSPVAKTVVQTNPLGFAGIGQVAPAKVVTQEEVIGPAGDRQVVTTVTNAGPSKIGGPVVAGPLGLSAVGQTGATKTVTQEEVIGPAGDSQIITTVTKSGPSKIGGAVVSGPLGLSAVGQTSPAKVVTQEEVIGPAGDRQVVTTVSESVPSKIGGHVVSSPFGLTAVGQTSPTKVVTQEEVIGPAGDSQVVTTVTETAGPSKIGGRVVSNPLGLTAIGQAPTKVITQEEVVGPAGDTQVVTTVSETSPSRIVQQEELDGLSPISALTASPLSQIAQDPIETAISQATLGDSAIISSASPISQSFVDPIGAGQVSIDDGFGSSSGAVKETIISEPTGILSDGSVGQTLTKITEVAQRPIAEPVVQQSISSDFDSGYGYAPRVSFLSSYPYDIPSRAVLRQALTRPIVQEQQQLEQILVK